MSWFRECRSVYERRLLEVLAEGPFRYYADNLRRMGANISYRDAKQLYTFYGYQWALEQIVILRAIRKPNRK